MKLIKKGSSPTVSPTKNAVTSAGTAQSGVRNARMNTKNYKNLTKINMFKYFWNKYKENTSHSEVITDTVVVIFISLLMIMNALVGNWISFISGLSFLFIVFVFIDMRCDLRYSRGVNKTFFKLADEARNDESGITTFDILSEDYPNGSERFALLSEKYFEENKKDKVHADVSGSIDTSEHDCDCEDYQPSEK